MVPISYNNANNLTKLQAESIVNRENRPQKNTTNPTEQG